MLPFKTILSLDRKASTPLYLQLSNSMIKEINRGSIPPGYKLPGSRKMAELMGVNRRTIITAFEELESQGWIEVRTNSGSYVSSSLPCLHPEAISGVPDEPEFVPFTFNDNFDFLPHFKQDKVQSRRLTIDAGYPDVRLAPLDSLSKNLAGIMRGRNSLKLMNYGTDFLGDKKLREELVKHLRETRSINVEVDNIMITRGSLTAFSNIFRIILESGDKVILAKPGFQVANKIIRVCGGEILEVAADADGMNVDQVEALCSSQKIKAVFIMPHHHNPTTVSLSAERRMRLLSLSRKYGFALVEDDYDYDFHYSSSPILPMASLDADGGNTIYVGSLSKTIAPSLRMGFIVASKEFVQHIVRLSRFLECHGNTAMERAIAILFSEGEINRYYKKALKRYHERRDAFCLQLRKELGSAVDFVDPEGGMAAWVKFDPKIHLPDLRTRAIEKGLVLPRSVFSDLQGNHLNAIRMGFASLDEREAKRAIGLVRSLL